MQHGHAAANVFQPPPGLTRRSEFRSAAEVRSRSATRPEPCRSHSAAVMTTMPPNLDSVQMLQQMMLLNVRHVEDDTEHPQKSADWKQTTIQEKTVFHRSKVQQFRSRSNPQTVFRQTCRFTEEDFFVLHSSELGIQCTEKPV